MTTTDAARITRRAIVADGVAQTGHYGREQEFKLKELPGKFICWQMEHKRGIYDKDKILSFHGL